MRLQRLLEVAQFERDPPPRFRTRPQAIAYVTRGSRRVPVGCVGVHPFFCDRTRSMEEGVDINSAPQKLLRDIIE